MEENKNSDQHREHPLFSTKKQTEDDSQQTVCEHFANPVLLNYTNIVFTNWFTNKMFASVYAALGAQY